MLFLHLFDENHNSISFFLSSRCDFCIAEGHRGDEEEEEEEGEEEEEPEGGCYCRRIKTLSVKDSARFLNCSLEKLGKNLKTKCKPENCPDFLETLQFSTCSTKEKPEDVFRYTHSFIAENYGAEHFELMARKQVCNDS